MSYRTNIVKFGKPNCKVALSLSVLHVVYNFELFNGKWTFTRTTRTIIVYVPEWEDVIIFIHSVAGVQENYYNSVVTSHDCYSARFGYSVWEIIIKRLFVSLRSVVNVSFTYRAGNSIRDVFVRQRYCLSEQLNIGVRENDRNDAST